MGRPFQSIQQLILPTSLLLALFCLVFLCTNCMLPEPIPNVPSADAKTGNQDGGATNRDAASPMEDMSASDLPQVSNKDAEIGDGGPLPGFDFMTDALFEGLVPLSDGMLSDGLYFDGIMMPDGVTLPDGYPELDTLSVD